MASQAEVRYDPQVLNTAKIAQFIRALGFGAELIKDAAVTDGKLDLVVSLRCTASAEFSTNCLSQSDCVPLSMPDPEAPS